jgi:hypothetical protein
MRSIVLPFAVSTVLALSASAGAEELAAPAVAVYVHVASWTLFEPVVACGAHPGPPVRLPVNGKSYEAARQLLFGEGFHVAPDPMKRPDRHFPELDCNQVPATSCRALFTWKNPCGGVGYVVVGTGGAGRRVSYVGLAPSDDGHVSIPDSDGYIIDSYGRRIYRQMGSNPLPPSFAYCRDGHKSAVQTRGKTCSGNGGVGEWFRLPPVQRRPD